MGAHLQLMTLLLCMGSSSATHADMTRASCRRKDLNDKCFQKYLARGADATSSSQYYSNAASKTVDGEYIPILVGSSNDFNSFASTNYERSPYIQIDLGMNMCIKGVKIWNRSNDHAKDRHGVDILARFRNALISVAESTNDPGFGTRGSDSKCNYHPGYQGALRYYPCAEPMFGRYVRVTGVNMYDYLNLYEIEVHGWGSNLYSDICNSVSNSLNYYYDNDYYTW